MILFQLISVLIYSAEIPLHIRPFPAFCPLIQKSVPNTNRQPLKSETRDPYTIVTWNFFFINSYYNLNARFSRELRSYLISKLRGQKLPATVVRSF